MNWKPFTRALPASSGWRVFPENSFMGNVTCRHSSGAEFVVSGQEIARCRGRGMEEIELEQAIHSAAKAALEQNEAEAVLDEKDRWIFERCAM